MLWKLRSIFNENAKWTFKIKAKQKHSTEQQQQQQKSTAKRKPLSEWWNDKFVLKNRLAIKGSSWRSYLSS